CGRKLVFEDDVLNQVLDHRHYFGLGDFHGVRMTASVAETKVLVQYFLDVGSNDPASSEGLDKMGFLLYLREIVLRRNRNAVVVRPRSERRVELDEFAGEDVVLQVVHGKDRKSTRLNSSHVAISYAVFCLKKKK